MEDDDDFGDLYSDVLQSFPSTSQPSFAHPPPLHKPSGSLQSDRPTLDLNLQLNHDDEESGHGFARVPPDSALSQTLEPAAAAAGLELNLSSSSSRTAKAGNNRDLGNPDGGSGGNFDEENFRFDLEEEAQDGNADAGLGPVIPGLSTGGPGSGAGGDDLGREEAGADDWDSDDSEDDLQIVLNETTQDPMALEMGGELDDGQNDGLGIGADGHGVGFQHPSMEEQEWGEDGTQAADGEKKEGGEVTKLNQGLAMLSKPGYAGHGYHTFHSQFKYVRPGAAPLQGAPAAGPVGAPGQVRPILNLGPMAGRGRGDWRPPVMKNAPGMQKGYGGPGWGNSGGGRGLGIGLDFTLSSHKTIFEVDIDGFEEKPWNNPGVDVTDFFNFGLTEESWKGYCKQLEQFRLASTMQSRICVYESGRSEQAYDPDMPPELAAAAGVSDNAAENVNFRADVDHVDVAKSSAPARPPMPTGRPIQVETGSGERLPSIDTRPSRMRESCTIIEIVCKGFAEGKSSEDDAPPSENDEPSKTNHTENNESDGMLEQSKCSAVHSSEERRQSSPVKAHHSESTGSREHTPVQSSGSEERHGRRVEGESPQFISRSNDMQDYQSDGSIDRIDKSNVLVSPGNVKNDIELNADHIAKDVDDPHSAVKPATLEDDIKYDKTSPAKNQDTVSPSSKRKTVVSRLDLSSGQDYGEDPKATRNGDNRKPRHENSKGYMKSHGVGEEAAQARQGESMRNSKRHLDGDERNIQKRNHDERHDMERSRDVVRGREDPPVHRVGGLAKPSYAKYESSDKRKGRDISEGVWQLRDENPHDKRARTSDYRKQDPRLLEHGDEIGSRYPSKAWDGDRIEKEDHLYSRKQIDTVNWRVHHEKDVGLRQRERDDSLKTRRENVDNYKRTKNEENPRRDISEKEELLLSRKESPGLRKREKEDHLDPRRWIDQERTRESIKDHHSVRLKDDLRMEREKSERPNDRYDRHRTKQYREGSMAKREREEAREPVRSGRGVEDKWASHAKEKDEFNDAARYAESKRRDRVDDVHLLNHRVHEDRYSHGTTSSNLVSKLRKDGASSHSNRNASSNHNKIADEKPKESARNKEYESRNQNSKRFKSGHSSHKIDKAETKHSSSQGNTVHQTEAHLSSIRKSGEEPTTDDDDEQQQSQKGRSKMERWTSHKERDFAAIVKPASSLKGKEIIKSSINTESSVPAEPADNATKPAESIDPKPSVEDKVPLGVDTKKDDSKEVEHKSSDPLQTADQHLDTVAKLKKRSERFKLPLPSEKESMNKKKETEALLLPQTETPPADPEVKSERPPRKRRWISS